MATETVYLVIRADRSVRAVRRPRLAADEIAIPVRLVFPDSWGRIASAAAITFDVPDFTPAVDAPAGGEE